MWNSCRNEMPWQNPLTKNPKRELLSSKTEAVDMAA